MTSIGRTALSQLLSLPIGERLEAIEKLVNSIRTETKPPAIQSQTPDIAQFFGSAKGVFGDGLSFQKHLRDEW